jgi:hypothetical protein
MAFSPRTFFLAIALGAIGLSVPTLQAQPENTPLGPYQAALQRQEQGLLVQYGKDLDKMIVAMKQEGELDAYMVFADEKKRFAAEKTVPDPIDAPDACRPTVESYHKARVELLKKYTVALDGLIKQLMMGDQIDEAKVVKAEKENARIWVLGVEAKLPKVEPVRPPVSPTKGIEDNPVEPESEPVPAEPAESMPSPAKPVSGPVAKDKPEAYFSFASPGMADGLTVEGAKWSPRGKAAGGSYEFDGKRAYITTPVVDSTGEMTWSVWINPRSFPTVNNTFAQFLGARAHAWVFNSDNTSLSFACQNAYGGSRLALQFFVQGPSSGGLPAGYTQYILPKRPAANRWYHVAGVLDSTGMHLYLDGKLLAESPDRITLATPCPLIIGANDHGPQRYFDGLIDEVMIFKRAFSGAEIRRLYESQR